MKYLYIISAITGLLWISDASGQTEQLIPVMNGRDVSNPLPVSAAQGAFNTGVLQTRIKSLFPSTAPSYPKDSLESVVAERAQAWLSRLSGQNIPEIQIDNLGRLSATARHDSIATQYFSKRLNTPDLSYSDRIYTLTTAFEIFADIDHPKRLRQATKYLSQIDALGEQAFDVSFSARNKLVSIYYRLGVPDSVVKYGVEAIDIISRMPFKSRPFFRMPFFFELADVLVPRYNGRTEIDRLSGLLLNLASPTESMIIQDSSNLLLGKQFKRVVEANIHTARLLGNQVPKVVGHFWINTPQEKGYQEKPLADGKIRIVEIGNYHCHWCLEALPGMKRIGDRFAGNTRVEIMYVTNTFGFWGVNATTPNQEVEHLKEHYVNKRGLRFPIVIWAPERESNDDGDFSIPESPNNTAFFVTGTPRFCVIDGQGRLRRVLTGYTRDIEDQLITAIEHLIAEKNESIS